VRAIKNLNDVQIVLRDLLNNQTKTNTKALDRNGLQIKNMGPATEANDAVTLSQLNQTIQTIPTVTQDFTVIFSNAGTVSNGDVFAPYIFGQNRVGYPTEVWISALTVPSTGPLTVEIKYNGVDILTSVIITLPVNTNGPVFSSAFPSPLPNFAYQGVLKGAVVLANGAAGVSVGICVKRNTNQAGA
jgi:hypothetical protein